MIDIAFLLLWAVIGAGMAYLILMSQKWSVFAIHPEKPKNSKLLIIGGAVIRWLCISIMFITASYFSLAALILVFMSFMITRLLILTLWQKSLNKDKEHIH